MSDTLTRPVAETTARELGPATVVDLGVGNLGTVERALRRGGATPTVTDDPSEIAAARRLVLPGVGAFRPPRERLRGPLEAAVRTALEHGAWLLGICVGCQLLFDSSEEFGDTDGLGLLAGRVRALPREVPRPHIGWNRLRDLDHSSPLLAGVEEGAAVYYVHSFAPLDVPPDQTLATTVHGWAFAAVAGRGRVFGVQFHPEKSGPVGRRVLGNFLEASRGALSGR